MRNYLTTIFGKKVKTAAKPACVKSVVHRQIEKMGEPVFGTSGAQVEGYFYIDGKGNLRHIAIYNCDDSVALNYAKKQMGII